LSENSVLELDCFLNNEQKNYLDVYSKKNSLQVLQLKRQFLQDSYDRLSFYTKDNYEIDSEVVEAEQKKEFNISEQIRSLNDSPIVCAAKGYTVKCECGSLNQSPILCRDRKLCPTCNKNYSRGLMKNIYRELTLIPSTWWAEAVLTYPKNYFEKQKDENGDRLTKAEIMDLMFKHSNKWIKETYGMKVAVVNLDSKSAIACIKKSSRKKAGVGCVMVCHSNNSDNPLSSSNHFHVHILIPDFVFFPIAEKSLIPYERTNIDLRTGKVKTLTKRSRVVEKYGSIKRIRFHKSKEKIKEDRKAWADILKYNESDVNVWFEYFDCKIKLMHKITYIVRGAVKDYNDYFLKKENQNRQMTSEERKKFYYHVDFPRGFNRVRWYGFLSNSQRKKFHETVANLELKEMLDPIYKTFEVCPKCFRLFNSVGSEEMDFDEKTMNRTLRMNLVTYENYHNCKMKKE